MAQYHVVTLFCIEHYLALIAACMPTLGPFFRFLRPSRLKQVAKGHKPLGEDVGGPWSRPGTLDHSLMYGSVLRSVDRGNDGPAVERSMASTMGRIDEEHAMKDLGKKGEAQGRVSEVGFGK
ncbi:MAG: hypothetical protein Q9207_007649 [Kuettlingeria erythrocarpa]